jgi:hypothetical protein
MTRLQAGWPRSWSLISCRGRNYYFLHSFQISSGANPASYQTGKAYVAWSWPLTYILCWFLGHQACSLITILCTMWGSHSSGYEEAYLLGHNTMESTESKLKRQITFNRLDGIIAQKTGFFIVNIYSVNLALLMSVYNVYYLYRICMYCPHITSWSNRGWRKLHNKELHNWYSTPEIIKVFK